MKSVFVNKGVVLGLILSIWSFGLYFVSPESFGNMILGFVPLLFYIGMMIFAVKSFKNSNEGFASFQEAWIVAFMTGLIGAIIGSIASYVLFTIVDPNLWETIMERTMDQMAAYLPEDQIEAAEERMMESNPGSFKTLGLNLVMGSVVGAIMAAVIALITKKEKPMFEDTP